MFAKTTTLLSALLLVLCILPRTASSQSFVIVETGQTKCYNSDGDEITPPSEGEEFYGQDAQFSGTPFNLVDNGDGTVTDQNTGLMWQQTPTSQKVDWAGAATYCESLELAGYDDWRMPTLKELWSIQNFASGWPYLDTDILHLVGELTKDQQFWSSNYCLVEEPGVQGAAFGVNHVTGHIKAYPAAGGGPIGGKCIRAVRGSTYGENEYRDNNDGTITDNATGLMWMQDDTHTAIDWPAALRFADTTMFAGYNDWRLPNVKELQSIVDYSGISPAIDPMFSCTPITNEADDPDYGYYWTSTSAQFSEQNPGYYYAWYVAFGYSVDNAGNDTHGSGAVRFDTKVEGGPLGEGGERYYNYIRLVRSTTTTAIGDDGGSFSAVPSNISLAQNYPNPFNPSTYIQFSLPQSMQVHLIVTNAYGREVARVIDGALYSAGTHTVSFEARDLPSGIYYYRLVSESGVETKKMVLMK